MMTFVRRCSLLALLLCGLAFAADGVKAAPAGFAAVQQGLAGQMLASAQALSAGRRLDATMALDRALHLGEFADDARGLDGAGRASFHKAHAAVKAARHALQNGAPERAQELLTQAAAALSNAPVAASPSAPVGEGTEEAVDGVPLLNLRGERLGEVEGVTRDGEGERSLRIAYGAPPFLGRSYKQVPLRDVLLSSSFVVFPRDIRPATFQE